MNMIDLATPSQVLIRGNTMGKNYHKGGITQTGKQITEMEEVAGNQGQDNQQRLKEQNNETQLEGTILRYATTVNKFNNSISACHVHNHSMATVVVNITHWSQDDHAINSEVQKEKKSYSWE